ncbi:MAG: methyl-accepting chemotaxis protein [Magnetospirillum sp.]|nr:methyl-accepting chemotaxis protein [Magnetospirillum sp.]
MLSTTLVSPDAAKELNTFGRAVQSLFRAFDNVRLSTVSLIISVLTAVLFIVGAASTVLTLRDVSIIAADWRDFDTGLGRRLDLMAELRGLLGYGGLIQHWAAWTSGDESAKPKLVHDIETIRALQPAWLAAHPTSEQRQAMAAVMRTVDAYAQALGAGRKDANADDAKALAALATITDILQQQRRVGADGVEDAMWKLGATVGGVMTLAAVLLTLLALFYLWFTRYRVNAPIQAFSAAMLRLAAGDKRVRVPFTDKSDEMGEMARTVEVFRDNMIRADQLEAEKRAADQALIGKAERRATLTDAFGVSADRLLEIVDSSVAGVRQAAGNVQRLAERTGNETATVAATAAQAAANVQEVASAADQMGASIGEIGNGVTRSAEITRSAVSGFSALETSMGELAGSIQKIGQIVALIDEIAAQTNLLALNASIEAQRAGDAGKGFSVVANEVKTLAAQTSRATQEIAEQIGQIQTKTNTTMGALRGVADTVAKADEVVASIASAINEQSAATREIARNVAQAAAGNATITESMNHLAANAAEVSTNAASMGETIEELSRESKAMQTAVREFLNEVQRT